MSYRNTTINISTGDHELKIPVGIDSAAGRPEKIRFKLINKETGNRLYQEYKDSGTDEVIEDDRQWKAFPIKDGDDQIELPPELIKRAKKLVKESAVNVRATISKDDIALERARKSYYLSPRDDSEYGYSVLHKALEKGRKALLATYSFSGQPALYAIWAADDGLTLTKLAYQDDLREHTAKGELTAADPDHVQKLLNILDDQKETETNITDKYREKIGELLKAVADIGEDALAEHETDEDEDEPSFEDQLELVQ